MNRTEALLIVELGQRRYTLPLDAISRVREADERSQRPRAAIDGLALADWQGRALPVIPLAQALNDQPVADHDAVLIRLAPPYDGLCLAVEGRIQLASLSESALPEEILPIDLDRLVEAWNRNAAVTR